MNIFASQKPAKSILFFGIIAFLLVGFLGLGHFGININSDGVMSNCPAMGMISVCQMNPLEHILAWQGMFAFTPNQNNILAALLLLLAIALGILRTRQRHVVSLYKIFTPKRRYGQSHSLWRTSLQEAFSNGILHPKIF